MKRDQVFFIHKFPNGITLLGEEMDSTPSGAFSILVPVGAAHDPVNKEGLASLLSEMFHKGAGDWNSKKLSDEFDRFGIHRSHTCGIEVSLFSGSLLGENLDVALRLYSTVLLEPHLPAEELESVRQLALQDLKALEDDPASKVMSELAKQFYPFPFGRSPLGTLEGVRTVTIDSLRDHYQEQYVAGDIIIAVTGKFQWEHVKDVVGRNFSNWKGRKSSLGQAALSTTSISHHLQRDTNQLQIALAYPSASYEHPDYYVAKTAVGILSGGMAGRLFIEVREKRGLVYRVSASHSGAAGRAAVFAYAGTTPENGQETLEVVLTELRKLENGVNEEELKRAKADLKSRLIMQAELSSVRAASLVNDWWYLKRLRTVEEMKSAIEAVQEEDIVRHVREYPANPVTLVTLGSKSLNLPQEIL